MCERIADLAQGHEAERRRQADIGVGQHRQSRGFRAVAPGTLLFVWTNYSFSLCAYSIVAPGDESAGNPGAPERRPNGRGQAANRCVFVRRHDAARYRDDREEPAAAPMWYRAGNSAAPNSDRFRALLPDGGDLIGRLHPGNSGVRGGRRRSRRPRADLRQYPRECRMVERGRQGRAQDGRAAGRCRRAPAGHTVRRRSRATA